MSDTKERLLEIASSLIQQKGVNGMSYQHLSDEIGIRKASIHYHFPKKDDLVEALIIRSKENYHQFYLSIANSDDSPINKLRKISEIYAHGIETKKSCLIGILSSECELLNSRSVRFLNEAVSKTIEIFSGIIQEAKDKNLITNNLDCKELAHTYYNILYGGQIIGRSLRTTEFFNQSVEVFLKLL